MNGLAAGAPGSERVLVARLGNTGDVLLSGPAVRAVAASARVTFVAGPNRAAAARLLPGVEDLVEFDAPWVGYEPPPFDAAALASVASFVDAVRARGVRRAFVLTSSHQSPLPLALLLRLAGVGWIAGISHDYPGALLDVRHRPAPGAHEVERALSLVATGGFALPPSDDGRLRIRGPLPAARPFPGPYVVVHPGASVPARGYDTARATALVDLLVARGWNVAVTGAATDRVVTRRVAGPPRAQVRDLAGTTDLAALAAVVAGAGALVCGNTGPAHVAAAVGTPVVSIFAPVVPAARWRPWGVPSVLLGDQAIACRGCRARRCPLLGQPCLAGVTAEVAADAVAAPAGQPDPYTRAIPANEQ